jgi:uncharacterized protein
MQGRHRLLPVVLLLFTAHTANAVSDLDGGFARDAIVIENSGNACYRFDVYLALTVEQQRRGLMHVRSLPPFTGMLFVYDDAGPRSMWMKNTFIPLDILFIRADGTVSSVAERTEPLSLRSIASTEAVTYVLELNGGVSEALRIDKDSQSLVARNAVNNPVGARPAGECGNDQTLSLFAQGAHLYLEPVSPAIKAFYRTAAIDSARYSTLPRVIPATLMRLESTM